MSEKDQIEQFAGEVGGVVDRFRKEYDLSYASVIGVLQLQIHDLCTEAEEESES